MKRFVGDLLWSIPFVLVGLFLFYISREPPRSAEPSTPPVEKPSVVAAPVPTAGHSTSASEQVTPDKSDPKPPDILETCKTQYAHIKMTSVHLGQDMMEKCYRNVHLDVCPDLPLQLDEWLQSALEAMDAFSSACGFYKAEPLGAQYFTMLAEARRGFVEAKSSLPAVREKILRDRGETQAPDKDLSRGMLKDRSR